MKEFKLALIPDATTPIDLCSQGLILKEELFTRLTFSQETRDRRCRAISQLRARKNRVCDPLDPLGHVDPELIDKRRLFEQPQSLVCKPYAL